MGVGEPKAFSKDFDPRKVSKHVARTVSFERLLEEIPVFGSELLVGLMPDGRIGRFRLHWPAIEPRTVKEAHQLREAVSLKRWDVPESLQAKDVEILDISAGVGHSGFPDPGFRAEAVVRVQYRKVAKGLEYPLSSTSYKYFDISGKEVQFTAFPKPSGTPADRKRSEPRT